jgi:hypothetical protein
MDPPPDLNNSADEHEDNDTSDRFPYPLPGQPSSPKSHWHVAKDKIVEKERDKKKWVNLVKTAQSNTKSFLGIDSTVHNNPAGMPHSIEASKSLINWNERVFKVMNNNRFFGGELKERRLDEYIDRLNEDVVDNTNPFMFYKMTGGSQIDLVPPKITVANMAMDGIRKLTKRGRRDEISKVG